MEKSGNSIFLLMFYHLNYKTILYSLGRTRTADPQFGFEVTGTLTAMNFRLKRIGF